MSVIRIIRTPAFEAALLKAELWWSGLSPRERWLVGTLGGLLAAVIVVFGIVKPLQAARAEALADIRTYETLAARVRAAGVLAPGTGRPQQRTGLPAQMVESAAREAGLTATLTPSATGLAAQVAGAPYEGVIGWIANVEQTTALRTRRAELRRAAAPGRVTASVEFGQ